MARDGSGVYHRPVGTDAVTDTTIESTKYNINVADVEQDLNTPRPIVAGGTGATSPAAALLALSGETAKQIVTNYDSQIWLPGSFYSATTALGVLPVAAHAFAGIAYYANATDLVLEVTDLTDAADITDATDPSTTNQYMRVMTAGVWGPWTKKGGSASSSTGDYLFDSTITFPPAAGQIRFNNATQNSTTEIFISHLTASGADNTGLITASIKSGYTLYIQDKDEPTKYKIFVTTANPVLSGGDFRVTVTFVSGGTDIVSAQRVLLSVSTGNAVCYDIVQSLTGAQQAQARANIGVTKKNYIVNGAMMVSQENGTTAGTVNGYYPVDQFAMGYVNAATQSAQMVASTTPACSPNRLRITITAPDASVGLTDQLQIYQTIEGSRVADLRFGMTGAKTVTLQFGVRAPAGTYCVCFSNPSNSRIYINEYVIAAGEANIDVRKIVTLPGDVTGVWPTDGTNSLFIHWTLMAGANYQTTAGSWLSGTFIATVNQSNFCGTNGNVFELFDVGLYESNAPLAFQVPDFPTELALCQRYWQSLKAVIGGYSVAGTAQVGSISYAPRMRMIPTVTPTFSLANASGGAVDTIDGNGFRFYATTTATSAMQISITAACSSR